MADRACGKRVGDVPGFAAILGGVNVNFRAFAIIEILAPVNSSTRSRGDVQRTCAAPDFVGY